MTINNNIVRTSNLLFIAINKSFTQCDSYLRVVCSSVTDELSSGEQNEKAGAGAAGCRSRVGLSCRP